MFELRPYQEEAIRALEREYAAGNRRLLVVLPTGTGKTVVFSEFLRRRGKRALVIVHREELLQQAVAKLRYVGLEPGIVRAELKEWRQITVSTIQTLARQKTVPKGWDVVVIDEAHHAPADSYQAVLKRLEPELVIGFTATPVRTDGRGMGRVFDRVAYERTISEMVLKGYLVPPVGKIITAEGVTETADGIGENLLLDRQLDESGAYALAVEALATEGTDRRAMVFTAGVNGARVVADALRYRGIAAEAVDGSMPRTKRRDILDAHANGELQAVVNCAVLTEGYDDPAVDCIVVARPTRSKGLYTQIIGRGLRPYQGKRDCLVIDVLGASQVGVCTSVMFEDAIRQGEGGSGRPPPTAAERDAKLSRGIEAVYLELTRVIATDSLILTNAHWQRLPTGGYRLWVNNGLEVHLRREQGLWTARRKSALFEDIIAREATLELAALRAEQICGVGVGKKGRKKQGWRDLPVSERQAQILRSWRVHASLIERLTRGQASDLITLGKNKVLGILATQPTLEELHVNGG